MALTDTQLDTVKSEMENGKNIKTILTEQGWESEPIADVRQQLFNRFTQPAIQNIVRTHIQPNMQAARFNAISNRIITDPNVNVSKIDTAIANLQACIVDLQTKKTELQG